MKVFNGQLSKKSPKYKKWVKCQWMCEDPVIKCMVDSTMKVWIPEEAAELKQRLCVIAHAGLAWYQHHCQGFTRSIYMERHAT
jgi:hypothetical protein